MIKILFLLSFSAYVLAEARHAPDWALRVLYLASVLSAGSMLFGGGIYEN